MQLQSVFFQHNQLLSPSSNHELQTEYHFHTDVQQQHYHAIADLVFIALHIQAYLLPHSH